MDTYTTTDGDMLDAICAAHYNGDTTMLVPLLEANMHLAEQPPRLPAGVVITLPVARTPKIQTQRLWD